MLPQTLLLTTATLLASPAVSASNVDPAHAITTSEFIGEIDWRPSAETGALINQYYCSGFIYSPFVGWISLGSGSPINQFQYQNNSSDDFGVNVLPSGALRGYAYGANIGWMSFSENGKPSVDWATGKISGSIYSANVGWIHLANESLYLQLAFLPEAQDSDGDSLPDAWEIAYSGNLDLLSGETDFDGDTQLDLDEYRAGTNPLSKEDFLGPVRLVQQSESGSKVIEWPTKPGYRYAIYACTSLETYNVWALVQGSLMIATGSTLSVALEDQSAQSAFYRIAAFPPLTSAE